MSDASTPPDLRWLIERNHAEVSADIAKLDAQVAAIPAVMDRYVMARVYEADEKAREARESARDERIKRLEDDDTSKTRGVRATWMGAAGAIVSAVGLEALHAFMRGSGH